MRYVLLTRRCIPQIIHPWLPKITYVSERRLLYTSGIATNNKIRRMKRKAIESSPELPKNAKKAREELPQYHLTPSIKDEDGAAVWPAPNVDIQNARRIILECAASGSVAVIVPDKDADGLSAGVILWKTLRHLGLPDASLCGHILEKGENVHSPSEGARIAALQPSYIFVLDQGSRGSPPIVADSNVTTLIIDHHYAPSSTDFPEGSHHVNACMCPPVATTALLAFEICKPLLPDEVVEQELAWLCALGTHGDLGNTFKWEPPFPDMKAMFKRNSKKAITDAVGAINAPRRTAKYNVRGAWEALLAAAGPSELMANPALREARDEIAAEIERCTHAAPKFSRDSTIALLRISSAAQVHPVIATRWAGFLKSAKLRIVMVANDGHLPDKVNFSCRIARCARTRTPADDVDIIATLKEIAAQSPSGTLLERMGDNFARGHVQASGGIVGVQEFEELVECMGIGEGVRPSKKENGSAKTSPAKTKMPAQKNTLSNYFGTTQQTKKAG